MKRRIALLAVILALLLFFVLVVARKLATSPIDKHQRTPVVVELFTSEGCSSCPPADDVLAQLEKAQPVAGAEIIALGQHVDYWNQLGWADPYSSAQFSARQNEYAQVFGSNRIYTPQMVVDGKMEFVGSHMAKALIAIAKAAQAPKATVQLTFSKTAVETRTASTPLQVRIEQLPVIRAGDEAEVLLAIIENNLKSDVSRGENAGRKLSHSAVVRKLGVIGKVNSQAPDTFSAEPIVTIEKGWRPENLRVVVFVQERGSRRVLGAAVAALPAEGRNSGS